MEIKYIYNLPSCSEHWESHTDILEILALQGRTSEEDAAGKRDDEEDGESSTEPEEERDRDADDDDDGDEDEGFGQPRRKEQTATGLTANMFHVLRENECE